METMENAKVIVDAVVASEEVKEAAVRAAEEIVAENSGSILKTIGKIGGGVAAVAGVLYLGYKFVAKPFIEKKNAQKALESNVIDAESEDDFADEYDDFNDPKYSEDDK